MFIEAVDVKVKNVALVNYQENYNFTNDKDQAVHGNLEVNENVFEIQDQNFKKILVSNERVVKVI